VEIMCEEQNMGERIQLVKGKNKNSRVVNDSLLLVRAYCRSKHNFPLQNHVTQKQFIIP